MFPQEEFPKFYLKMKDSRIILNNFSHLAGVFAALHYTGAKQARYQTVGQSPSTKILGVSLFTVIFGNVIQLDLHQFVAADTGFYTISYITFLDTQRNNIK